MFLRRTVLGAAAALLTAAALPAFPIQAATPAAGFVEQLGNRALATFSRGLSAEQATQEFRTLLVEGFDLQAIGRFVLGRYWNTATPAQQQEYLKLFENMIVDAYAQRFRQYSGETFKVINSRQENERDHIVTTQIVRPNGPPVNVDWRVRDKGGNQFNIVDVIVEGVSMSVTQRSEFASVVQQRGGQVEGLLAAMRERAGQ